MWEPFTKYVLLKHLIDLFIGFFSALEWIDHNHPERIVLVFLEQDEKKISVYNTQKVLLRIADLTSLPEDIGKGGRVKSGDVELHLSNDKLENVIAVKLPEYDLVCFIYVNKYWVMKVYNHCKSKLFMSLNVECFFNKTKQQIPGYISKK